MDNTTTASPKKHMVNNGILLGIISVFLGVIIYVTNNHLEPHWAFSVLGILIFIVIIIMALKAFKKENGGFLSLGQALKIGLGIAIISALIGAVWQYVLMTVLEPTFMEQIMEVQMNNMLESNPNMSQEQIDATSEMQEKFASPFISIAFQVIGSLFFGFIISLIAGLVMKKNNPYADA